MYLCEYTIHTKICVCICTSNAVFNQGVTKNGNLNSSIGKMSICVFVFENMFVQKAKRSFKTGGTSGRLTFLFYVSTYCLESLYFKT
jgi:hypothetical protein